MPAERGAGLTVHRTRQHHLASRQIGAPLSVLRESRLASSVIAYAAWIAGAKVPVARLLCFSTKDLGKMRAVPVCRTSWLKKSKKHLENKNGLLVNRTRSALRDRCSRICASTVFQPASWTSKWRSQVWLVLMCVCCVCWFDGALLSYRCL